MHNKDKQTAFIIFLILLIVVIIAVLNSSESFMMPQFGLISDDIHDGNPLSYSGKSAMNLKKPIDTSSLRSIPRTTYYGNGAPLANELYVGKSYDFIPTISSNNNLVHPSCCPSAYSTSSGCICPLLI